MRIVRSRQDRRDRERIGELDAAQLTRRDPHAQRIAASQRALEAGAWGSLRRHRTYVRMNGRADREAMLFARPSDPRRLPASPPHERFSLNGCGVPNGSDRSAASPTESVSRVVLVVIGLLALFVSPELRSNARAVLSVLACTDPADPCRYSSYRVGNDTLPSVVLRECLHHCGAGDDLPVSVFANVTR